MKKQPLTLKNIRSDLLQRCRHLFLIYVTLSLFLLPLFLFVSAVYKPFKIVFTILVAVSLTILPIFLLVFCIIVANRFKIKKETLIQKDEGGNKWFFLFHTLVNLPPSLYFRPNIKCWILFGQHYPWSSCYTMNHWEVYNSSLEGDEFYVVYVLRKAILVYNMRFFELQKIGN